MRQSRQQDQSLKQLRSSVETILSFNTQQLEGKKFQEGDEFIRLQKEFKKLELRYQDQIKINDDLKQMFLNAQQRRGSDNGGSFDGQNLLLQQQVRNLEERLEDSYRNQHQLENLIEEYEVNLKRIEDNYKQNNKKFHDMQKKYTQSEQSKRDMEAKMLKLEQEKNKISEKWTKLSNKNKNEERQKSKVRQLEVQNDFTQKEINSLSEKLEKLERENIILRKTNEGANEIHQKQLNQLRKLQETIGQYQSEKGVADKVTNELLSRISSYEQEIDDLSSRLNDTQNSRQRDSELNRNVEHYSRELQSKEQKISKQEEIINSLKQDLERTNQQLISKNMENQSLKQSLNQLQGEMINLQNELEVINQYQAMKEEASQRNDRFPNQQVQLAFTSLIQLLNTPFSPFDMTNEEDIDVYDLNGLTDTSQRLIYDGEVSFAILRAEKKLNILFQFFQQSVNSSPLMEFNQTPHNRLSSGRMEFQRDYQQQQQNYINPLSQLQQTQYKDQMNQPLQNDMLGRQVKIQNLVIQNHAGVQENNKIININANSLVCNKENQDINVRFNKKHNNIPKLHTQSYDNFNDAFPVDQQVHTTKNSVVRNSFQRNDPANGGSQSNANNSSNGCKQLGPMKISNTPNALFQQNFQAFKSRQQPFLSSQIGANSTLGQNDLSKLSNRNSQLRSSGGFAGGVQGGQAFSHRSNSINEQIHRRNSETRNSYRFGSINQ
ncbi:UNKNOWN [Stylonychia lemnae]|uniref:Uncharacterized protein n=1 Tax=Stylonychia lemnae TaxID=5949 RepID=A0A078A3E4_STYLE|nr:UNKNOWN [Stylonychia lemnae]|eukprot:CDW76033.1 UNKNOWN [Stylonychia lemnae]